METNISSPERSLEVLELMEKFFRRYPPEKAERILSNWISFYTIAGFVRFPEDIQEFADFIEQLHELEQAVDEVDDADKRRRVH
ncbi:hypothetical protein [Desertivirga xinjiangensis]|uniref:hypothetical protein n=1 Tax=Desertivirga xinjiangensis TaxID=539206 RepID=UPI00210CB7CC|nr:hypothetical protein [Pedobacter xinjiangensis]